MDKYEIKQRLSTLPREASIAFAMRAAMRWMPFLAVAEKRDAHSSGGYRQNVVFPFWKAEIRPTHLLALFRSQVFGTYSVFLPGAIHSAPARAARAAAAEAATDAAHTGSFFARATTTNDDPAAAAYAGYAAADAYAADDAYAAFAAHVAEILIEDYTTATINAVEIAAATDAAEVADAADAADAAAYAAINPIMQFFANNEFEIFSKQYEFDLRTLAQRSAKQLLITPLWQVTPPSIWQKKWALFKRQVLQLDSSFLVWLQWYRARLGGNIVDFALLEKWVNLPEEIEASSPLDINRYLAGLTSAKQVLNRVRTIFIGYGDAGKTSLIRTLYGEPIVEGKEPMTPGIEIREWDGAGNDVITHFWDFGGQVMAHATHQFFLRSSCLYVLVLSARAEINATEQAEYWLTHVRAFGASAPVLIIGNKDDQVPVHLDMASLREKYPNVRGFYPLSCTKASSNPIYQAKFQSFLLDFKQHLARIGTHQVMFTDAQFKVVKELRSRAAKQAFIGHKDFNDLCRQHRIGQDGSVGTRKSDEKASAAARASLLDLLDKLGVVIHFKDLPGLSEHVLNPRWLTYGVYRIMYAHRARLSLADMVTLLRDAKVADEKGQALPYPEDKCLFIAMAMQQFKLCYPLRHDNRQFIIPGLLETDQPPGLPKANFDKAAALAFKVAFTGFVPRHVMPEMIVERNEEIENDLVWQYGALLSSNDANTHARALMQVDYQARELTIWVAGPDARDYLLILRNVLLRILSRLTMQTAEWIRLPRTALLESPLLPQDGEDWAGYTQIIASLKKGKTSFTSPKGWEYDLNKVAKLYVKPDSTSPTGPTVHYGDNHFYDQRSNGTGNQYQNLANSQVGESAIMADQIHDSFNTHHSDPELAKLLAQLLTEIQKISRQATPSQAEALNDDARQLITETQREAPRRHWYQASLTGLGEAAKKLGEVGTPLLDLVEKLKNLLGL